MVGTLADPVRLWPYSRITEVHWNTITHIAVELTVKLGDLSFGGPQACDLGDPPGITRNSNSFWLTASEYVWGDALNPVANIVVRGKNATAWSAPGAVLPTVTGYPSSPLGSYSYGATQKVGAGAAGTTTGGDPYVNNGPQIRVGSSAGGSLGFEVPDRPGTFFTSDLSPVMEHLGDIFTGSDAECFAGVKFFPCSGPTGAGVDHPYLTGSTYNTLALALAGVSASFKGKTFSAIGSYAHERITDAEIASGANANETNVIWVLLKRDDL